MAHSITNEVVTLDENGEGNVKYPPVKAGSFTSNKPVAIRWLSGKLLYGEPGIDVTVSYISLYDGEIGE